MTRPTADRVIDGRDMEPPEPFVNTMEALDSIGPGERLLLLIGREPLPLYRALELNGFAWETGRSADGSFEVSIWRK